MILPSRAFSPLRARHQPASLRGTPGVPRGRRPSQVPRFAPLIVSRERRAKAVAGALRRMELGFAEPLSVGELAREVGLSPNYFSQMFREETGQPPHDFLLSRRVDAAKEQLANGGTPADVAANTGFADQSHLTREFRRRTGETPAAFAQKAHAESTHGEKQKQSPKPEDPSRPS